MKRAAWLLLLGVILGVSLGLVIGWVIAPVEYYDTFPYQMRADYQDEYVYLIALTYQADGKLPLAQRRLELVSPDDPTALLIDLAGRLMAQNASIETVKVLADLARALQVETPAMRAYLLGITP